MIDFSGVDILIEDSIPDDHVRRAIAAALQLAQDRVAIIADIRQYPRAHDVDAVCVISVARGEFATLLSIQASRAALRYETPAQLLQALCEQLGTRFITPDDEDPSPDVMWLVSPGAAPRRVRLDPAALEDNRYTTVPEK